MNSPFRLKPDVAAAVAELKARFGARARDAEAVRRHHGTDESHHAAGLPDVVVEPETTEEVAEIVRIAGRHRVPLVPFGAGSGLEGAAIPVHGGISLDTIRLNRILEIREADMIARVEAGVRRQTLNAMLRDTGLFFPVDPGADASIGGMVGTGASGTNAVRFGVMRENVLGLTVVLADGRVIRTGSLARKSSAGYDLTRLVVGSEGTLGVVTEVTLRLHPLPDSVSAVAGFATLEGAVRAVVDIRRMGLEIGRVELLDARLVGVIGRHSAIRLPEKPTLYFEFHGSRPQIDAVAGMVAEIVAEHGGDAIAWMRTADEARALWETRRLGLGWAGSERPGSRSWPSDVCVPVSRLAEVIVDTEADVAASHVPAYIVGHVGDGNFHCVFKLKADDPAEVAEVARLNARIVERAIAAGGTSTGEHGVGLGKRAYLEAEHGRDAVAVMALLKKALDPDNILNPGKVLPDDIAAAAGLPLPFA
ncbi:FAD linked oxidase domain protein [uncultured Pleomorphomonas sp.]|uniref:D-lactate dehydrogenase (cytochrome) n=1 Tax=uncultured Pleomorphomonas sp. TaxID=442121 RepID=A0A212LH82_9HYPH|nr:FAD-linked oxidase C-terminal domain-containing protein [uncultured Pleomorphomonas sp.]SCM76905.1 FAD linked oxidase domain protein [uncultured Pleomorphomonas sp.]